MDIFEGKYLPLIVIPDWCLTYDEQDMVDPISSLWRGHVTSTYLQSKDSTTNSKTTNPEFSRASVHINQSTFVM
jgi:hypothetical protein